MWALPQIQVEIALATCRCLKDTSYQELNIQTARLVSCGFVRTGKACKAMRKSAGSNGQGDAENNCVRAFLYMRQREPVSQCRVYRRLLENL